MVTHYLSTALRHFRRHKVTTAINLICLTLGLTCFLVAFAWTRYLTESDAHHSRADRIHVITERLFVPGTDVSYAAIPNTAWPVATYLKADLPQLSAVARATLSSETPVKSGERKTFMQVTYADPGLFDIFDFQFLAGAAGNALREPRSAVVSEAFALRMFGTTDVLGRPLLINNRETVFIRGVIAAVPLPSHMSTAGQPSSLYFEAIVSMDTHEALRRAALPPEIEQVRYGRLTGALSFFTYVLLPTDGSLTRQSLAAALADFGSRHADKGEVRAEFGVRHVSEIPVQHLNAMMGTGKTGVSFTTILLALGLMVLVVSCLNYANLAAAQAATRTREVTVRKIIGAARGEMIAQHAVEAFLITLCSMALAAAILTALMAALPPKFATPIAMVLRNAPVLWTVLFILLASVSALASSYPSLLLARIKPAQGLRSGGSRTASGATARWLVGAQFGAAGLLLIMAFVMQAQNEAVRRSMVAVGEDPVVIIANDVKSAQVDMNLLRSELARQPGVRAVTALMTPPHSLNNNSYGTLSVSRDAGAQRFPVVQQFVEYDFFETVGFRFVAGRTFDRSRGTDELESMPTREQAIIVDRELTSHFGWTDPAEAVGKILYQPSPDRQMTAMRIVGVVERKPLTLMGLGATTTTYQLAPRVATTPLVRISRAEVPAALAQMETVWDRLAPNIALKRRFLDENFEQSYEIFSWVTTAVAGLATLSFVIAAMGLVGMAVHVVSRRRREIGVRKTLGASVPRILAMLLVDFSRPIIFANLAIWPIAFFAAYAYLSVFVERAPLTPVPFIMSLLIAVLIACVAVIAQAGKAARVKPAEVLRYE